MKVTVNLKKTKYDVIIRDNVLNDIASFVEPNKKYFIISDDGVPFTYINKVSNLLKGSEYYIVAKGEKSKSLATYHRILKYLLTGNYGKKDYIIALGGGVVGDLAGYVAATFKRGMNFINIPTTTLAMVDSSIGGKVALNLDGVKNCIGTYYHPSVVLIDPKVLETLPKRHINNGMVEALKTGLLGDPEIFNIFENNEYIPKIKEVIYRSLKVKASIVEKDEKEKCLRKVLNLGHTFGHAYESYFKMKDYLHGESVGLGLLTICRDETYYPTLQQILSRLNIKSIPYVDEDVMIEYIENDKKCDNGLVDVVFVKKIGEAQIESLTLDELRKYMRD